MKELELDIFNKFNIDNSMNEDRDPLFEEAARFIVESQNASKSMLQRRFSIGYARAHKLMDQLEKAGIIGINGGVPDEVPERDDEKMKSPFIFSKLIELLDEEDENEDYDDPQDSDMAEDDNNGVVSFAELMDLIGDEEDSINFKMNFEDYNIIGDTTEIDNMHKVHGRINLDLADFLSTLSKDTPNYISTGRAEGQDCVVNALADALHNLPIEIDAISKLLFNVWMPKEIQVPMQEMKSMSDFIKVLSEDIDVVWGIADDESMEGLQARVSLIAASK